MAFGNMSRYLGFMARPRGLYQGALKSIGRGLMGSENRFISNVGFGMRMAARTRAANTALGFGITAGLLSGITSYGEYDPRSGDRIGIGGALVRGMTTGIMWTGGISAASTVWGGLTRVAIGRSAATAAGVLRGARV